MSFSSSLAVPGLKALRNSLEKGIRQPRNSGSIRSGCELPWVAMGAADSSRSREGLDKFLGNRSLSGCWRMREGCPFFSPTLAAAGGPSGEWWRWPGSHISCWWHLLLETACWAGQDDQWSISNVVTFGAFPWVSCSFSTFPQREYTFCSFHRALGRLPFTLRLSHRLVPAGPCRSGAPSLNRSIVFGSNASATLPLPWLHHKSICKEIPQHSATALHQHCREGSVVTWLNS